MFTYFTYVDLSWFRNCSGGGGEGMTRLPHTPPPPLATPQNVSSRVNFRKFAISPHAFVTASLSLYPFYDLSKMTGKMWIIPHRFFFCIKLSLLSAMMKIIHTTFYCIYTYFFSNEYISTLKIPDTWLTPFEF